MIRTGQKRTSAETGGALNSAARSGCCTAQFFGTASPSTKITTISNTVAATTPHAPNQCAARMPTKVADDQLADEHQQQHRVEEALRVLDQPDQHLRAASPFVLERHCLHLAHPDEAGLGEGQERRRDEQQYDDHDQDDVDPGHRGGRGCRGEGHGARR